MNPPTVRLYRSRRYRSVGGVCAGLALSRGWSVGLTRLVTLALASTTGVLVFVYLVCWVLLPAPPADEPVDLPHDPFRRSKSVRVLGGVCGGIAQFLHWDVSLVRIIFVLTFLLGGVGLIPYLYAWMAIPLEAVAN